MPSNPHKSKVAGQLLLDPEDMGSLFRNLETVFKTDSSSLFKEQLIGLFHEMFTNVIFPVATTSSEEIEDVFELYLSPFQIQLKKILELINAKEVIGRDLERYESSEWESFFNEFQNRVISDSKHESALGNLNEYLAAFSEYGRVISTNSELKPDVLDEVLSYKIDLNEMQKYILGSLMAFISILVVLGFKRNILYSSPLQSIDWDTALSSILLVGTKNIGSLLAYMKTIDVLCNRERINELKELIHNNPKIAGIVGRVLIAELPIEYRINNIGRFIAIDYEGHVIDEANTLAELNDKLHKQKSRHDWYVARLGHSYLTRVDV